MEQKKTDKASLERQRRTGFLLGLVLALASLFVALEWNTEEPDYDIDERLFDELAEELLLQQQDDREDLTVVVIEPPKTSSMDRVEVVETMPELSPAEEALMPSVGETEDVGVDELQPEPPPADDDEPLSVRIVEQLPEFPGGMSAFIAWLTKHLQYPAEARERRAHGRVVVSFIVNRDGTVSDATVAHAVDPQLDGEAMRVIRMMPRWKPGIQNNEPCRTMVAVPIVFSL